MIAQIEAMGLPFKNFKQKVKITNEFIKEYKIESIMMNDISGILYMERKNKRTGARKLQ